MNGVDGAAPQLLVVAKAPVPRLVKTRLAADVGPRVAADVAAAALLDTLAACAGAVGPERCHLALAGELSAAARGEEIARCLRGWQVRPQCDGDLGRRLAHAHAQVAGPVVQVGMDTPQVTPELLRGVAEALADHDAVLGPAEDGGWWVLALRDPSCAAVLDRVPMSSPTTYDDTLTALRESRLTVGSTSTLRDVDELDDADLVAAEAPQTEFARVWRAARTQTRTLGR